MSSVFPLDKDRQVIAEYSDPEGYIHKTLRLFAPEGDWIDIEVVEKFPGQEVLKSTLLNENNRIVAESRDKDGYINKISKKEALFIVTNDNSVVTRS